MNYWLIIRNEDGEKLAEQLSSKVPGVGEIITVDYLTVSGKFEILKTKVGNSVGDLLMVTLIVKAITP